MTITKFVAATFAALAFSTSAHAALLVSMDAAAGNTATDYSDAGVVSFDLALANFTGTTLSFVLQEADLGGPLSLSAMVFNLSGVSFPQFNIGLQGIRFAAPGSVSAFSQAVSVNNSFYNAAITFANGEPAEFQFGNPTLVDGRSDWLLDTTGMRAGDTFSIVAEVPEPSTVALMLPLLLGGLMVARRRQG
ncbi:PEP-CTERM sorting domain-containing protein [Massilia aurea]|uniref:PEP-CTERM sorting domain-containing protein n=1 Tax=Massilia aurea TaxID=373040 RepID=UPI00346277DB